MGITQEWNAVIFGDQVHLVDADQPDGRGLVGPAPVTKQTLFQDIFGKSAFIDIATKHNLPSAIPNTAPWKGKQVEEIFKTPTYLMPPLGTLFDPLMGEFLKPRPMEEGAQDGAIAEHDSADEDIEMEEEGADAPIVVGNRLERIVSDAEMVSMIELFKSHCLRPVSTPPITPATPKVNGYHKYIPRANGVAPSATPKTNGISCAPKMLPSNVPEPVTEVPIAQMAERITPPAVKAGQKRKKSFG